MSDPLIAAIYGGVLGAIVAGAIAWRIGARARQHNYYSTLVKLMADHNWSCLTHKVSAGLPVTFVDEPTVTVCYQQLNLLLYAWLHKDIVKKDGTLNGWQRWANAIVEGAKKPGRNMASRTGTFLCTVTCIRRSSEPGSKQSFNFRRSGFPCQPRPHLNAKEANITINLTPASRCSAAAGYRERYADPVTA